MKKLLSILLVFCLVLSLAACGGSSAPTAAPAESTPAESTPAESEPAESEPACAHEWAPASYAAPETCTLCGETRGDAKPTYFEENGLTAAPLPGEGEEVPLTYLTYTTDDPEIFSVRENGVVSFSQTVEPAEEEGYKLVTLNVSVYFPIESDESTFYAFTTLWNNSLYDLYTGRKVPGRSIQSNDGFSYEAELPVEDAVYLLKYEKNNHWETSSWAEDEEGTMWVEKWCSQTIVFLLPEEYDGLVYALGAALEVPADDDYEIDESEMYVLDLTPEELAGTAFFRVGA